MAADARAARRSRTYRAETNEGSEIMRTRIYGVKLLRLEFDSWLGRSFVEVTGI